MKNQEKQYRHRMKVAKRLAALTLVATALSQPTFSLTGALSVSAQ